MDHTQLPQFFTLGNILVAISALEISSEEFFHDGKFRGGQCHIFKLILLIGINLPFLVTN